MPAHKIKPIARISTRLEAPILIAKLRNGDIKKLKKQERMCIVEFMDSSECTQQFDHYLSQREMADFLGVSFGTIIKDLASIRRYRGLITTEQDVVDVAGELRTSYELAMSMAIKSKNANLVWKIALEYVKARQNMGLTVQEPVRVRIERELPPVADLLKDPRTNELVDSLSDILIERAQMALPAPDSKDTTKE